MNHSADSRRFFATAQRPSARSVHESFVGFTPLFLDRAAFHVRAAPIRHFMRVSFSVSYASIVGFAPFFLDCAASMCARRRSQYGCACTALCSGRIVRKRNVVHASTPAITRNSGVDAIPDPEKNAEKCKKNARKRKVTARERKNERKRQEARGNARKREEKGKLQGRKQRCGCPPEKALGSARIKSDFS